MLHNICLLVLKKKILKVFTIYTQYIKKRNTYIVDDNLSNFKDVHFKLAGYIDLHVYHKLAEFHNFPGTVTPFTFFEEGYQ